MRGAGSTGQMQMQRAPGPSLAEVLNPETMILLLRQPGMLEKLAQYLPVRPPHAFLLNIQRIELSGSGDVIVMLRPPSMLKTLAPSCKASLDFSFSCWYARMACTERAWSRSCSTFLCFAPVLTMSGDCHHGPKFKQHFRCAMQSTCSVPDGCAVLQEEQRTEPDLADLAGSAQLHAQLRILGAALQTAQLDPAQFGLDARVRRDDPWPSMCGSAVSMITAVRGSYAGDDLHGLQHKFEGTSAEYCTLSRYSQGR